jgi:predicted nucleotidyltransferase
MNRQDSPLLDADQIRLLLTDLGARLADRGIEARLFLVGGAAMALAFSRRRITRDLDAVFEPKREIYEEAGKLARERGLPEDWLNDGVKGLLPDKVAPIEGTSSFSAPGIRVGVASAEYLFAMKAMAARQEADGDDLRTLAAALQIKDVKQALDLVERFYGAGQLTMKTQLILEGILAGSDSGDAPEGPASMG